MAFVYNTFDEDDWWETTDSVCSVNTESLPVVKNYKNQPRGAVPEWFVEELKDGNPGAALVVTLLVGAGMSVAIVLLRGFGIIP